MILIYEGFYIHRVSLHRYFVTGSGFRGYAKTESDALKMIDGVIAGQCQY
jgi:hypothetical protein